MSLATGQRFTRDLRNMFISTWSCWLQGKSPVASHSNSQPRSSLFLHHTKHASNKESRFILYIRIMTHDCNKECFKSVTYTHDFYASLWGSNTTHPCNLINPDTHLVQRVERWWAVKAALTTVETSILGRLTWTRCPSLFGQLPCGAVVKHYAREDEGGPEFKPLPRNFSFFQGWVRLRSAFASWDPPFLHTRNFI